MRKFLGLAVILTSFVSLAHAQAPAQPRDYTAHIVRVVETNLLEDTVLGTIGEGQTIHFHMNPWEIKTLRLARR
jgi:hypothetical protein